MVATLGTNALTRGQLAALIILTHIVGGAAGPVTEVPGTVAEELVIAGLVLAGAEAITQATTTVRLTAELALTIGEAVGA